MATSLMSLPDEIKLLILENIDIDIHNTLLKLRQTHPWFRDSIPLLTLHKQLLAAEHNIWKFPLQCLVCYTCHRVLPKTRFGDLSRKKGKGLGGVQASKRFCLDCGIKHAKYSPGSFVTVDGAPGVVCAWCGKFFQGEDVGGEGGVERTAGELGLCRKHWGMRREKLEGEREREERREVEAGSWALGKRDSWGSALVGEFSVDEYIERFKSM
ncbi:MAG: hypothetical protein Q9225_004892 [Loekoesia sp. 1 TL-2023]